jgi:rubrerythrin
MKNKIPYCLTFVLCCGLFISCSSHRVANQTMENLKIALTREVRASATYDAFRIQAEKEELSGVAKLFKALAIAENIHTGNFIKALKTLNQKTDFTKPEIKVDSTRINLQNSIKSEMLEIDSIYPAFKEQAEVANEKEAALAFDYSLQAEKTHRDLLVTIYDLLVTKAPDGVNDPQITLASQKSLIKLNETFIPKEYYVCPADGRLFDAKQISKCSLCKTAKNKFIEIK